MEPHVFSYANEGSIPAYYESNALRFSEDYWGYYNSAGSENLIPNFQYVLQPPYSPDVLIVGDNKTPRLYDTMIGQLTRITYPTKGYTQFDYELNRYGERPGTNSVCPGPFDSELGRAEITLDQNSKTLRVPITLPTNLYGTQPCFQIEYGLKIGNKDSRDITYGEVRLTDDTGYELFSSSLNAKKGEEKIDNLTKIIKGSFSTNLILSVALSAENFSDELRGSFARIYLRQMTANPNGLVETDGGGLRIKRQISCPSGESNGGCLLKDYSYADGTGQSTGRLLMPLFFKSTIKKDVKTIYANENDQAKMLPMLHQQITSASQVPIVTSNGNSIYYELVTVKEGGLTAAGSATYLGSTRYSYIPLGDAPDQVLRSGANYPLFSPVLSADWKRGKPVSTSVLTASDVVLKETATGYLLNDPASTDNIGMRCAAGYTDINGNMIEVETIGYGFSTGSHVPAGDIVTDYSYDAAYTPGSRTQLTQSSNLYYEGVPAHHLPTRSQTQTSKGETLEVRMAYPTDLIAATGDLLSSATDLLSSGRQTTLIRQQTWVGGVLQKTDLNLYKRFTDVNLVLPWKSVQLLSASTDGPTTEFNAYTGKGNLLQSTTNGGYPVSYLWAYNGSCPVAEVKNATIAQVQTALATIGQSLATLSPQSNSLTLESQMTNLRGQLANVTTGNTPVLFSSFIHQPGVGIRSTTAPNGLKTSYDYDGLGRLKTTFNPLGQPTKAFAYNYRTLGVATPLANQTVTAGQPINIIVPANPFIVPGGTGLNLTMTGLPAGLTYQNNRITGTASTSSTTTVVLSGQSGDTFLSSSFLLTILSAEPFTLLPPIFSCNPGSVVFSFQTKGGDGSPISYIGGSVLGGLPNGGPHRFVPNQSTGSTITLSARQGNNPPQIYTWNWQAACKLVNQRPVVGAVFTAPVVATVGYPLTCNLPADLFNDPENGGLWVEALGLPAGLYLYSPTRITGVPTQVGSTTVTLRATDPLGYVSSTTLVIQTISSTTAPAPLEIVEPIYNCSTRELTLQTKPGTGNGTPIEYLVVGQTGWSTQATSLMYEGTDSLFQLMARQVGTTVSYLFNRKNYCWLRNKSPYVTASKVSTTDQVVYPQTAVVGQPYSLTLPPRLFTDPNNDPLSLRVLNAPAGINLTNNRILTGLAGKTGAYRVQVEATDPYGSKATTEFSLSSVAPTAFALLQPSYVCATGSFTFNSAGGNATPVQYMAVGITGWTTNRGPYTVLPFVDAGAFTLNAQQSGVTYTYSWDWKAQCRTQNLPPVSNTAVALPSQTATNGVNFSYTLPANLFTDPDGQPLSLSAVGLPVGLALTNGNGINGMPSQGGIYPVQIQARDPWGGLATRVFSMTVVIPPVLKLISPSYLCGTGELWFNSTGGNGMPVQYMAVGITGWTTTRGPYTVLPFSDAGPFTLNAQQSGVTYTYSWDWKGYCRSINQSPRSNTAVSLPSLTVVSGSNIAYTIPANAFIDPDSPTLTYSATGLPSGLSLNGQTITGTTTALGTYSVTIKATDSYSATGTRTMVLTVSSSGPAFQLLAPSYNCSTKAFYFNATGGNGTTIQYMSVGITGWTTTSGPYTVNPASDAGPFTLQAQQSGVVVTYNWNWKLNCP